MLQAVNRIASVETRVVKLPSEEPYLGARPPESQGEYYRRPPWRSLYSDRFETLLVKITCADGSHGWGEALAPVAPEVPQAVVDRLLGPVLIGADPRQVRPLCATLTGLMRERGHLVGHQADALAAVDIALWDLAGKAYGVPVYALLGGAFRTEVPTYVSGLTRPVEDWLAHGVQAIKLHLGRGVDADLAAYDEVARPGLRLAVDAHWAYDPADALRLGRALDERRAWFLEAPLVPEDLDGHRELAASIATPVAVGETLRNRYEFRAWLAARAALPVANQILTKPLDGGPACFPVPDSPGLGVEVLCPP